MIVVPRIGPQQWERREESVCDARDKEQTAVERVGALDVVTPLLASGETSRDLSEAGEWSCERP